MHIPDEYKTAVGWTRYIGINAVFVASIYFGLFEGHDGAANLALFMGWFTVAAAAFITGLRMLASRIGMGDDVTEQLSRMDPSVVPFWFDCAFDILVVVAFVYTSHQVLAVFYVLTIFAGKDLRDIPKNVMLKKLKSQQS